MTRSGCVMPTNATQVLSGRNRVIRKIQKGTDKKRHSHTLATEVRAEAHVVELRAIMIYLNRATDDASVVPTADVIHRKS